MPVIEAPMFLSLCDAMPLGVCMIDMKGKILYWNAAAEQITGYLATEVIGRVYRTDLLVHWQSSGEAKVQNPASDVMRNGRPVEADLFLRHKEGHRLPMRVAAFPLRDQNGELRGVGQLFDPIRTSEGGQHEHEVESSEPLHSTAESYAHLSLLLQVNAAFPPAVLLIEMPHRERLVQHGGMAMVHQAVRVLARTVEVLLPPRHFLGCWSNDRLIAILQECGPEALEEVQSKLASVGSACALKWWGDRIPIGLEASAGYADGHESVEELIQRLEGKLQSSTDRSK